MRKFEAAYIRANPDVEKKLESMKISKPYVFKKIDNNVKIFNDPNKEIKIGYININSLYTSRSTSFINNDTNLLQLDFLLVADTRLSKEIKDRELESNLINWRIIQRFDSNDSIAHMGLLFLQSRESQKEDIVENIAEKIYFKNEKGKKINQMQVMSVSFMQFHLTCAFVYIRKTPTTEETKRLENYLEHFDVVMGDLNLDAYRAEDAERLDILCERRTKVLNEITTIRFNQLDHILLDCNLFPQYFATSFRNHTTDHHTIVLRIPALGNKKSDAFKELLNFNQMQWTRGVSQKRGMVSRNIEDEKLNIKKRRESVLPKKRISSGNVEFGAKVPRINLPIQSLHRTFKNRDAESCWINSCLQLVLTALDHEDVCQESGSFLWEQLIFLKKQGNSSSLDPLPIRDTIVNIEKARILEDNIAPLNRLFGLGSALNYQPQNLMHNPRGSTRLGQQDCKDFFVCLSENKHHWLDVYKLFMVEYFSFTTCTLCKHVSIEDRNMSLSSFFLFECPNSGVTMSSFLGNKLGKAEAVFDWRDEDGCKKKTKGENSTRITDLSKTNYLIIIVERLVSYNGNLQILRRKVPLGEDVELQDRKGKSGLFTPFGVIHHKGEVIGNDTCGHYEADVLKKSSNQWFRTSDDMPPKKILRNDITEQGYIFLYKKF